MRSAPARPREEAHRAIEDRAEEAPLIPRIVCSEALL